MINGKIAIKKRNFTTWLAMYILLMPFFFAPLMQFFKLPDLVKYTIDLAWLAVALIFATGKFLRIKKNTVPMVAIILIYVIYCVISYPFNFQSPFYLLWGMRNNFRFYIAFFAFVAFFDNEDVESIFKIFDVLFWINAIVTVFQYFVLDYKGDYLGGIFGVERGANAYTIIFISIVITYSVVDSMLKKSKTGMALIKCIVALFISSISELKFFFVVFILILIMATLFTGFAWKKVFLIILLVGISYLAFEMMKVMFDTRISLTFEDVIRLATQENYSSEDTVNRLSAIPILAKTIVNEPLEQLFGLGLGNCDTSTVSIFNTPFYQTYGYLRYNWFSCAILFLEVGIAGLLLNLSVYIVCFFSSWKNSKKASAAPTYCYVGMIMSVISVLMVFYNASFKIEAGYLVYFALAIPFISAKKGGETDMAKANI